MRFGFASQSGKKSKAVTNAAAKVARSLIEPLEQRQLLSGTVSGLITDASGTPLVDARVRLVSSTPGSAYFATTDSSGDYVINDVTDGSYTVKARDHGYVPNASASFTVADGADTAPTVKLTAIVYGTVTGQVTDSTGTPLSDALVRLIPATSSVTPAAATMQTNFFNHGNFGLFATTDSNGDYTINNVVAGSYTVKAKDKGYTPNTSASFTVAAGSNTAPTVELTAIVFGTVTGTVTDSTGTPLSDAMVVLTLASSSSPTPDAAGPDDGSGGGGGGRRLFATTDSSGDYTIDNVPAGSYTVTARDHGYVKNTSASFTVATGSNTAPTVKLTAIAFGTVTGEVTDSSGTPLDNAWVILTPATSSSPTPALKVGGGSGSAILGPISTLFAKTNANGDYTLGNVVTGSYTVTASDQGYVSDTSASFTVATGSNTAPTVKLTAIVYGTVNGKVTDSNGGALSGALVFLVPQGSGGGVQPMDASSTAGLFFLPPFGLFATTDSSGDYVINNVAAGSYEVTARDQGYESNTSAAFNVASGSNTAPTVALTAESNQWPPPPILDVGGAGTLTLNTNVGQSSGMMSVSGPINIATGATTINIVISTPVTGSFVFQTPASLVGTSPYEFQLPSLGSDIAFNPGSDNDIFLNIS